MTNLNTWRLIMFGMIAALWAAIIAVYIAVAQLAGGVTKLIDTVFGDGWSAVTLIIAMAVLVGVYIGVVHLSATNRERGMSRFWGLVAAGAVILVAIIGASWITWAWSILWVVPLSILLLLGAAVTVWLAESRPVPEEDEEEDLTV